MNDVHQAASVFSIVIPPMQAMGVELEEHIVQDNLVSYRLKDPESGVTMTIAIFKDET